MLYQLIFNFLYTDISVMRSNWKIKLYMLMCLLILCTQKEHKNDIICTLLYCIIISNYLNVC